MVVGILNTNRLVDNVPPIALLIGMIIVFIIILAFAFGLAYLISYVGRGRFDPFTSAMYSGIPVVQAGRTLTTGMIVPPEFASAFKSREIIEIVFYDDGRFDYSGLRRMFADARSMVAGVIDEYDANNLVGGFTMKRVVFIERNGVAPFVVPSIVAMSRGRRFASAKTTDEFRGRTLGDLMRWIASLTHQDEFGRRFVLGDQLP